MSKRTILSLVILCVIHADAVAGAAAPSRDRERPGATFSLGAGERTPRRVDAPPDGAPRRFIVEFDAPRLTGSRRTGIGAGDLHRKLRDDLAALDGGSAGARSSVSTVDLEYRFVLHGAAVTIPADRLAPLRELAYVRRVVPDAPLRASLEPGVTAIGADRVWSSFGTRGAGMVVAILDTGIDYRHPSLGAGIGPGRKVLGGFDFVNGDDDPLDDNGHGTHVAGIVAASADDLLGVAPDASLLAFKVLDRFGEGSASLALAALDRCADPNGDGDTTDHVAVANLSLGAPGTSEDPLSRAVDAAVEIGIVVCVAAGNDGAWHTIGSPGSARLALTVGAVDAGGSVASFSSRGPAAGSFEIKPDVAAPGVSVRSTLPGGATAPMSGTSMATPHVAGIAALIRALHPDWTARELRNRIATTANGVDGGAMAAGSGIVDAMRAASGAALVTHSSISFGAIDLATPRWTASRRVTLRNAGATRASYTLTAPGSREGLDVAVSPRTIELAAGERIDAEITVEVENAILPFPEDGSSSWTGTLVIESPGDRLVLPWAVVKACRIRAKYLDDAVVTPVLLGPNGFASFMTETGGGQWELLVAPGRYDVILHAMSRQGMPNALVAFEERDVVGDLDLDASLASASLTVSFDPRDESGAPFNALSPGTCSWNRTILLPGESKSWIASLLGPSPAVLTSPLSPRFTIVASEICLDAAASRFYSLQYEPLRGVQASTQRQAGGHALLERKLELRFDATVAGDREFSVGDNLYVDGTPFPWATRKSVVQQVPRWTGTLYHDRPVDAQFAYFPRASAITYGELRASGSSSPSIHAVDNGSICYDSSLAPPGAYVTPGTVPLVIGSGPVFPQLTFVGAASVLARVAHFGTLDERYSPPSARLSLFAEDGLLLAEGESEVALPDTGARFRLESVAPMPSAGSTAATSSMIATMGGSGQDPYPPSLTSLIILDGDGRRVTDRIARGSAARLRFSAIDGRQPPARATLRYRISRSASWSTIPIAEAGRDYSADEGHLPRGTTWEASLGDVTARDGSYDLELAIEDAAGNTATVVLSPAVVVAPVRPRPVRR